MPPTPEQRARDAIDRLLAAAGDDMTAWLVLRKAPPLPFLPPHTHGQQVVVVAFCREFLGD